MINLVNKNILFEKLSGKQFSFSLFEYLNKTDIIKYSDNYIDNFDKSMKNTYVNTYPIKDIKEDILEFVQEWINDVSVDCGVRRIRNVRMSNKYGFSTYVDLDFNRPNDKRLYQFYNDNSELYNDVTFRFSEHESKNDDSDITDWVNITGKTFDQASEEMKYKIQNYVTELRSREKQYLKKLDKKNKRR